MCFFSVWSTFKPIALWPLNTHFGFKDVIGGKDGSGTDVYLDSNSPVDLSGVASKLPGALSHVYEDQSYRFQGSSTSYIQIPGIIMPNDFTIVSFIKPEKDGPIFQWDPSGVWGDHLWVRTVSDDEYHLFFKPMGMNNNYGTPINISK